MNSEEMATALRGLIGQHIKITYNETEKKQRIYEGIVQAVSLDNKVFVFKPDTSSIYTTLDVIQVDSLERHEVEIIVKTLKPRTLQPLSAANARRHLLDQHMHLLSVVNVMTDVQALAVHAGLDHSELGHVHQGLTTRDNT